MSNRYKGGIISATPPTTTGGESGTASGAWTLEQQMQAQAAGLWPIQPPPLYIEDVFSTWLYTGNGSSQTITNGINLSGKGGLVWLKRRNSTGYHILTDTARGAGLNLSTNDTIAQFNDGQPTFNSNGFNLINDNPDYNASGSTYVSWTFRKQEKFFDCVTYTGDGTTPRNIPHNLGSAPGCMIVKRTNTTGNWEVYHRSMPSGASRFMELNSTDGETPGTNRWASTNPTSTVFTVGDSAEVNASGSTYVAYLFAHDAGGFGPTESDNVISCGSFTTDGSGNATVDLGYEPQWVMIKRTNGISGWNMYDNMRGWSNGGDDKYFQANSSAAEDTFNIGHPTATGMFLAGNSADSTYIYIAIRRGPMRTPTSGTSVFGLYRATSATSPSLVSSFPVDMLFTKNPASSGYSPFISSRLTSERRMNTGATDAETTDSTFDFDYQNGALSVDITDYLGWMFRRAPGFFDEVCYTGTGSATTFSHNLAVIPELMIVKGRSSAGTSWIVYSAALGNTGALVLNATDAVTNSNVFWNSTTPTSSVFTVANGSNVNGSGTTFVNYLFATCAGVSKVGSYTGTGTTQTINCGFTGGSRFVLIKRTDSTGDWYVWDSARGIVAGDDPYLLLNSTAAEVTNTDYIDTTSVGFEITSTAPAAINANGGTFIFLAIS